MSDIPTLQISFGALSQVYTAQEWQIPNYGTAFKPIPADAPSIEVPETHPLLTNRPNGELAQAITFEEAGTWGSEYDDCSVVYTRGLSPDASKRFCLRMVLNVESWAEKPLSNSFNAYLRLVRDARFHSTHLLDVEGRVAPQHYGLWMMDTGAWAGKVLFSITQWCGRTWAELSQSNLNTEANRLLIGRAFEILHDHDVYYDQILWTTDFRHILIDVDDPSISPTDLLEGKGKCYIVDFSVARPHHRCARRLPVLPHGVRLDHKDVGCLELADVIYLLGFMDMSKNLTPEHPAYKALQWHDEYCKRHPDEDNTLVLMAQRQKLFTNYPTLYFKYLVSFEDEEQYAKAIIEVLDSSEGAEVAKDDAPSPETIVDELTDKLQLVGVTEYVSR